MRSISAWEAGIPACFASPTAIGKRMVSQTTAMQVRRVAGMFVVTEMGRHPSRPAALQAADPEEGKAALQPLGADEALWVKSL